MKRRSREEQLARIIAKQKGLIREAEKEEVPGLYGAWTGFLSGMWMTGAITFTEYREMYREIEKFRKGEEVDIL